MAHFLTLQTAIVFVSRGQVLGLWYIEWHMLYQEAEQVGIARAESVNGLMDVIRRTRHCFGGVCTLQYRIRGSVDLPFPRRGLPLSCSRSSLLSAKTH